MKSFIIAIALAAALTISGILCLSHLENVSERLSDINKEIIAALSEEDTQRAIEKINELSDYIDKTEPFYAATGSHEEIDNIEMNLAELKSYAGSGHIQDALAKSEVLEFLFEHIPKNSRLKIENIL